MGMLLFTVQSLMGNRLFQVCINEWSSKEADPPSAMVCLLNN